MRRKSSELNHMPTTWEARSRLLELAGDGRAMDRINRAYAALRTWKFTFNRVRDILHADKRIHVWPHEIEAINAAIENKKRAERRAKADQEARDARTEYCNVIARLARLEAALSLSDADFHREDIGALRSSLDRSGREDGALD